MATKDNPRPAGYAAHVKNADSNNIGVAAAMSGASEVETRAPGAIGSKR